MEIATHGLVYNVNDVAVQKVANWSILVEGRLFPFWNDDPFIVVVLVMVACELLLIGSNRICLEV